ncbi:hypothetical protein BHE74_00016950 [Ensete ventricosum]|nr:hypothetical protein BHE74_00016950 [Ensete ventricosum]
MQLPLTASHLLPCRSSRLALFLCFPLSQSVRNRSQPLDIPVSHRCHPLLVVASFSSEPLLHCSQALLYRRSPLPFLPSVAATSVAPALAAGQPSSPPLPPLLPAAAAGPLHRCPLPPLLPAPSL